MKNYLLVLLMISVQTSYADAKKYIEEYEEALIEYRTILLDAHYNLESSGKPLQQGKSESVAQKLDKLDKKIDKRLGSKNQEEKKKLNLLNKARNHIDRMRKELEKGKPLPKNEIEFLSTGMALENPIMVNIHYVPKKIKPLETQPSQQKEEQIHKSQGVKTYKASSAPEIVSSSSNESQKFLLKLPEVPFKGDIKYDSVTHILHGEKLDKRVSRVFRIFLSDYLNEGVDPSKHWKEGTVFISQDVVDLVRKYFDENKDQLVGDRVILSRLKSIQEKSKFQVRALADDRNLVQLTEGLNQEKQKLDTSLKQDTQIPCDSNPKPKLIRTEKNMNLFSEIQEINSVGGSLKRDHQLDRSGFKAWKDSNGVAWFVPAHKSQSGSQGPSKQAYETCHNAGLVMPTASQLKKMAEITSKVNEKSILRALGVNKHGSFWAAPVLDNLKKMKLDRVVSIKSGKEDHWNENAHAHFICVDLESRKVR